MNQTGKDRRGGPFPSHVHLIGGSLKNRSAILSLLQALEMAIPAEHEEVMQFIENYRLMSKGLTIEKGVAYMRPPLVRTETIRTDVKNTYFGHLDYFN